VSIDIPLFKGHIDPKALDEWLQLLDSYFVVNNLSDEEKLSFPTLKFTPNTLCWWECFLQQRQEVNE